MRLIDADALDNRVLTTTYTGKNMWALNLLSEYIKEAPTIGGWISVKDRLPDEGEYVLVWESQGFAYCDKLICGIWNIGANNGAIITHWMPLPEPPKEGN